MVLRSFNASLDGVPAPKRADIERLFFIEASVATRKTFESSALHWYIKSKGLKVLSVVFSAASAQLLEGDRARQPALKILFKVHHQSTSFIDVNIALADDLCSNSSSIWDMNRITRRHNSEVVDRTLRKLMCSTMPCSGKGFPLSRRF